MVKVGEASALTAIEDSTAANCERTIGADGKASGEESVRLEDVVELELLVGDDLALAVVLIGKDTVL